MPWKDIPQDRWRPCSICGHTVKTEYIASSMAGAMGNNSNDGCVHSKADWHHLLEKKKNLMTEMVNKAYPQSIIDELGIEITVLKSRIPKPVT